MVDQKVTTFKKNHFTAIQTKTLIGYNKKVEFFIQHSDHVEFWTIL